eukprot:2962916-Alexandrium_andersonii.AAC.1
MGQELGPPTMEGMQGTGDPNCRAVGRGNSARAGSSALEPPKGTSHSTASIAPLREALVGIGAQPLLKSTAPHPNGLLPV